MLATHRLNGLRGAALLGGKLPLEGHLSERDTSGGEKEKSDHVKVGC